LTPAFKFNGITFVWRCNQCAKMFFSKVEEASPEGIAPPVLFEFGSHSCAVLLACNQVPPAQDGRDARPIPIDREALLKDASAWVRELDE
jgi:hypothetical protein